MEKLITTYIDVICLGCNRKKIGRVPIFGNEFNRATEFAKEVKNLHLEHDVSRGREEMEKRHFVDMELVSP